MRILVDIGHPGHVHFYKHAIWQWEKDGHEVIISARNKDVTLSLLDHYGFDYHVLSKIQTNRLGMLYEFVQRDWALYQLIRKFSPDIITAIGGVFIAPISKLLGKPSVVFTDSEHVAIDKYLTYPFATVICTPNCFLSDLGSRHIKYAGYHELAYLHPNYFEPDISIYDELGISIDQQYIILRFISWDASHDIGQSGFSTETKWQAIQTLKQFGKIFITSESELPSEFEPYRLKVDPHRIHHVLYYAQLCLSEGATMATEAGILGTPSIYTSSLVGTMGNFLELMDKYQLVFSYYDPKKALNHAVKLIEQGNAKEDWKRRQKRLLNDTVDVMDFIDQMITHYV